MCRSVGGKCGSDECWRGEWSLIERAVRMGWLFVGVVWWCAVLLSKRWMDKGKVGNAKHLYKSPCQELVSNEPSRQAQAPHNKILSAWTQMFYEATLRSDRENLDLHSTMDLVIPFGGWTLQTLQITTANLGINEALLPRRSQDPEYRQEGEVVNTRKESGGMSLSRHPCVFLFSLFFSFFCSSSVCQGLE